jgi:hypothetical protein
MSKYTLSKVLWWIQKAASKNLYVTFDVEGHQYDPETGWDFGVIDPLHFSIHGEYIITEGYSLKIYIRDITSLSLCKLESDKNGRSKIIPVH